MKFRTLIADDEPLALSRLKRLLAEIPSIELIGEAANGTQLVSMTEQLKPELIISDIKMPGKTGLEAAQEICRNENPPAIIFCTAFDEFAVKAFELAAIGYLVKPVDLQKLNHVIEQASVVNQAQLSMLADKSHSVGRLLINSVGATESIDVKDVEYFQAEEKVVVAYLVDQEKVVDYSLNELTESLGEAVFRVHRATLVNLRRVKSVFKAENGQTLMQFESGRQVLVSRRMVAAAKRAFKDSI